MRRLFLCLLSFILLTGCVTTTYSKNSCEIHNDSSVPLEKEKVIVITVSEDGTSFEGLEHENSGMILSKIIKQEAEPYCKEVVVLDKNKKIDDFSKEELAEYDYVIIPKVLLWEDKLRAYSITSDGADISVEIYNSNKELLKSGLISVKSLTTHGPEEMLTSQFKNFFDCLFN